MTEALGSEPTLCRTSNARAFAQSHTGCLADGLWTCAPRALSCGRRGYRSAQAQPCSYRVRLANRHLIAITGCSGQSLTDTHAVSLARELINDTTVTELLLAGNNIGDAGAKALAIALRSNKTLLTLSLASNKITDVGAKEFIITLQQNTTIRDVALSGAASRKM